MAEVCTGGALLAFFLVLYCETHRKDLGQGTFGVGEKHGHNQVFSHGERQKNEEKISFLDSCIIQK